MGDVQAYFVNGVHNRTYIATQCTFNYNCLNQFSRIAFHRTCITIVLIKNDDDNSIKLNYRYCFAASLAIFCFWLINHAKDK